jgi:hypothetical protein
MSYLINPFTFSGFSFSGALVKLSGNLSAVNHSAGNVAIPFDVETYDYGGWHDNVTNNTRFTVPANVAFVLIAGCVERQNVVANSYCQAEIFKNGASLSPSMSVNNYTGDTVPITNVSSTVIAVTAGDYFELMDFCGDSSIDIVVTQTWFNIIKVG